MEFATIEPFGDHRQDMRMWAQASFTFAAAGGKNSMDIMPPYYKGERKSIHSRDSSNNGSTITDVESWNRIKRRMTVHAGSTANE